MLINPDDPLHIQNEKQDKIIQALMRRANRQRDVGPSAFRAFQSAINLQHTLAEQSRDLERAETELESARYERERTRRHFIEALSSVNEGFALFLDERLDLCNELFRNILPDVADEVRTGLKLADFFKLVSGSENFVSADTPFNQFLAELRMPVDRLATLSAVIELSEDRWYQLNAQRTTAENLVLLMTDISSLVRRNRDEKETLIDEQADYLQAVFQNMSAGVCTFSPTGDVMMQNGRFRDLLGLSALEITQRTSLTKLLRQMQALGLIRRDQKKQIGSWWPELKERGGLRKRVEFGENQILDIQANRLPDGGFVVELTDVSLEARASQLLETRVTERTAELTLANDKLRTQYEEKARVEEELRLAKERAESAVSSKTRFLAAASHDLLQPVNAAKLLISTLCDTTRDMELYPMMERLSGALGSAEQLLRSLLDISRLESPDPDAVSPTTVGLGPIMESVYADQTAVAEQKGVTLDMAPSTAFVHSDPLYLMRSLQNLVVNAIQYTEPGGRVLVGCRRRGRKIILEVWDTGIGIAPKDQTRIFEEFARGETLSVYSGMGLGLSVVDRACSLLGHRLTVRSKVGVGSVFSVEMDRIDDAAEPVERVGAHLTEHDGSLDNIILVIENDEDVLYGMTRWLEQWGASVLPTTSTAEALRHVTDMGIAPDIILADYQLDGDDTGIEAIARLRASTDQNVPAILITANNSKDVWRRASKIGISVMIKPARLSRLRAMIMSKVR